MRSKYWVVSSCSSAARFLEGDPPLVFNGFPSREGALNVSFTTLYTNEGFNSLVPRRMYSQIRGTAESLDLAIGTFNLTASWLSNLISVANNAAIDTVRPEFAYCADDDVAERDFFQSYIPAEEGIPGVSHRIRNSATVALATAIVKHERTRKLRTATAQYAHALQHWRTGEDLLAVSHLYMAAECLGNVAMAKYMKSEGMSEDDLVDLWNVQWDRNCPKEMKYSLASAARRELIFCGDRETYRKAGQIRNAFFHGNDDPDLLTLRWRSSEVKETIARFIRLSILRLSGLNAEFIDTLLDPDLDSPIGLFPSETYIRGVLSGEVGHIGPPYTEHPQLYMDQSIDSWKKIDQLPGAYDLSINEVISATRPDGKATLPRGIKFIPLSREHWVSKRPKPID